ncbi:carbohydrate ABC transporter permease [Microbacterium azadirachtae]|uniref:carbohydrate ABC transporter permease n=1 Tax=Microbacterium azadirachtae TaxID=582680 RepID=UPI00087ED970|nr:carbohydrate ABC transporter permease [Microbacterium azadirachtae]SDL91094.1 raffinose/stachyose/melibiose transport system permease protein [Microbacterium azadirachtae]SEG16643.1 raffinose/stachyose/melibiose transport system permease protein [Microbacterium azadirachtae]SEG19138.1 raffinose/stachyose/melibiose transport system permease protein [Microbacterium azadirachtae]
MILRRAVRAAIIVIVVILMGAPLYLLATNAFKTEKDILGAPFALPTGGFTLDNLVAAATSTNFNVIAAYGTTGFLVVAVNVVSILVTGPAAYAIGRGVRRGHRIVLLSMLAGLFIPSQTIVIPVIYVLKSVGLMGTMPGLILFQTALTIPTTLFLFTAYVQSIPRELDEAARIDGASRLGTFWRVIFPLMTPAIATAVVLNAVGVWADFVNPRIILGPSSGLYTVTTGVYAAISKYSTDYTLVYSNMLLAVIPVIVFYVLLQKRIIGGLTSGAVKG